MDAILPLGWDADLLLPPPSSAERKKRWRDRQREAGIVEKQHHGKHPFRPGAHHPVRMGMAFVGVDGEGAGVDELGRQNFLLLRAGDHELFAENKRLTTRNCIEFLLGLPRDVIYVGFAFGYDTTMILRDLPKERLDHLFMTDAEKKQRGIQFRYTFWENYGIEYLSRNYLRFCRVHNGKVVPDTSVTIYEVFGFFQCSFLKALKQFSIGEAHLAEIEHNKAERRNFTTMTDEVRRYNKLECELLAQLMEEFRNVCYAGEIRPRTWNGSGKLAAALLQKNSTARKTALSLPDGLMAFAQQAYYGGRFEITRTGAVEGPIHEYDIRSAYPAAMQTLPCLLHGKWTREDIVNGRSALFVASVQFGHANDVSLCGLPIRTRQHRLFWPRQGNGVYWSCEIEAARNLGAKIELGEGWCYEQNCDCKPFDWVRDLYDYRRSIGAAVRGIPIKLGINSIYGQLARRVGGGGPWQNYLWAGIITAQTRAWLLGAAAQMPSEVLMLATDAVYSRTPLALDVGEELGQWEHAEHPRIFITQPGLYWGPPKPKTRGVPRSFFETHTGEFEAAWEGFMEQERAAWAPSRMERMPSVTLPLTNFIGIKLAHSRGKPDTAGVWKEDTRKISFDWSLKRQMASAVAQGGAMRHFPHDGAPDLFSCSYAWDDDTISLSQEMAALTEGLPDFLDFSAPGFGE